jgi:LAS superfamily LD-carboxypeptidase LdcB
MVYKMDIFSRHELIRVNDGYTLVLHVDKQTSEFAEDFFSMLDSKRKELQKGSLDYVRSYINENYRGTKIDTVNIMLGSLLVATIAYSPIAAAYNASVLPAQKVQVQTKEAKDSSVSKPPAITINNLVLVNKTHSLPAGYVPKSLVYPNVSSANKSKTRMTAEAASALEALFAKAMQDNIKLTAISGYRSYELQNTIFASNINKYGSAGAANQFSARPGQSEHQTGLAMDVSSPSVNFTLTQSYGQTREGKWLKENAPKYGFIVRYTKGNENITGYQFEPWHIRYVGKSASLEIASRNITLEEFLGKT